MVRGVTASTQTEEAKASKRIAKIFFILLFPILIRIDIPVLHSDITARKWTSFKLMNLNLKRCPVKHFRNLAKILIRTAQPVKEYISQVFDVRQSGGGGSYGFQIHFKPAINLFIFKTRELKRINQN